MLVGDLSLGVQRQAAFLVALAHAPDVLVLDEPTSGVDALARASLWDTIRDEADRGVGVLVTTHYMEEAQECDRLLLLADGRLVAEGSEADIVGTTTAVAVHTDDWASAFAALNRAGIPVILAGRAIRVADTDRTSCGPPSPPRASPPRSSRYARRSRSACSCSPAGERRPDCRCIPPAVEPSGNRVGNQGTGAVRLHLYDAYSANIDSPTGKESRCQTSVSYRVT